MLFLCDLCERLCVLCVKNPSPVKSHEVRFNAENAESFAEVAEGD